MTSTPNIPATWQGEPITDALVVDLLPHLAGRARSTMLKDVLFTLDSVNTRLAATYALTRDLTDEEDAATSALEGRRSDLEAQADRLFFLATGVPWTRYREVRS